MRLIRTESLSGAGMLTITQLRMLESIDRGYRLPSELARELKVTPATTSESVEVLARRGLVERYAHPQDRRVTLLRLTDAGSTQLSASRERALDFLESLLERLEPGELQRLYDGLEPLAKLLHEGKTALAGRNNEGH
jgi:DNA-binding MarR family transcriptional regulator